MIVSVGKLEIDIINWRAL